MSTPRQLSVLAVFCGALCAHASVIGVTGDFTEKSAGSANYSRNAYNDPNQAPIRIWVEQLGYVLNHSLALDTDLADPALQYVVFGAGAGQSRFLPAGGPTLPAGTRINSYFVYFDPRLDSAFGTVTFEYPVLGIVAFTSSLRYSDDLRVPAAPYPSNPSFLGRGWEMEEWGQLSADRRTLTFSAGAIVPGDQFRILTESGLEAQAAPEPFTWLAIGAGLATISLVRRRNRPAPDRPLP